MFKTAIKNLYTTLLGGTAGGSLILEGIQQKNITLIIGGVSLFLAGLFAKDAKEPKTTN